MASIPKKLRERLATPPDPFLVTSPLRYADHFLEKIPHLHTIASSCYYLGRKAQS